MPSQLRSASATTRVVRAGIESDQQHGAVVPPLYLSSNYAFAGFGEKRRYDYTRSGNPTRDTLGDALAELEGGVGSVICASGMAALNVLAQLLQPGDLCVVPHDCYGGTFRLYESLAGKRHFDVLFVDQTDDAAPISSFIRPRSTSMATAMSLAARLLPQARDCTMSYRGGRTASVQPVRRLTAS